MSPSNVDSKKVDDTVIKEEQTEESKGENNLTDSTVTKKEEPSGLKQEIAGQEDKQERKAIVIDVVDLDLIKDEVMSPKIEKMEEDVDVQITGTSLSGDDEIKVGVKAEKKKKETGITGIGTREQEKEEKDKGRENKRRAYK